MLIEEIRSIRSAKKDLRNFGITLSIVLGLLSGMLWWKGKDAYIISMTLAFVFLFCGFVFPSLLKPLQKSWMTLAVIIGFVMTRIILSVLFYIVFTSIGLVGKIFGRTFLDLEIDHSKQSYWIYRRQGAFKKERYEKQF